MWSPRSACLTRASAVTASTPQPSPTTTSGPRSRAPGASRRLPSRAGVTVALATALALLLGQFVAAAPAGATTVQVRICGTWVMQQVSTSAELARAEPGIKDALKVGGVRGLSLRVPWSAVDRNFALLTQAADIAASQGKQITVRIMAGVHTPARIFDAGAFSYQTAAGKRVPKPFSSAGVAGNPVFEREYEALVKRLARWSADHKARVMHLPWYGYQWAEIYNGPDVQSASGYRYAAWLGGHRRLLKIAKKYTSPKVAAEFALSGHWGDAKMGSTDISKAVVSRWGEWSDEVFVQGNGLGVYNNDPTNQAIFTGRQMFGPASYDWIKTYDVLKSQGAVYVEVYTPSFTAAGAGELARQSKAFRAHCRAAAA